MATDKVYIWGFPGVGKSSAYLFRAVDVDCAEFEFRDIPNSSLHQAGEREGVSADPNYPENYFSYLQELDADAVLINCHISLLERIDKEKLLVVYPAEHLKEEYLQRYSDRGDNETFLRHMEESFDDMVSYIRQSPFRKYEIADSGIYLNNLINGGNLMGQFITKDELTTLFHECRELGVFTPPEPYGTLRPAAELAQLCFEGAFEADIPKLQVALKEKKAEIEKEQLFSLRRGGLSREELKDKILDGIVNGALSIHHGQIAPYSYGFEVRFADEEGKTDHRWGCYCKFEEVADTVVQKIEAGQLDKVPLFANTDLKPVNIHKLLAAIEDKENNKLLSFTEATKLKMEPRGYYSGHVANLNDVHTGRGLDGIILGKFHGDYSSMTTTSQSDMLQALVAMKGFCLDAIGYIPSRPLTNFVLNYLKTRGIDITTYEKLQAWIDANPDKCALPENRSRKPSLRNQIQSAGNRAGTSTTPPKQIENERS